VTVGDEFKEATQERLITIAKEALLLHSTFEGRKITNKDDAQAFIPDTLTLLNEVRQLEIDSKRVWRYYRDGGTERLSEQEKNGENS